MTTIKKILDKIHPKRQYNGIQEDNRPQSEKDKDYKAEEVFAAVPPVFRVVNDGEWAKYQVRAQDGSGSCVANTIAKMFEVMYKLKSGISIKFSHAPIYINRVNKPNTGMVGTDALDLAIKIGTCKEIEMPSENKNDQELDAMTLPDNYDTLNKLVHPRNRLVCPVDFDYVASMVNKLGCAMVWVDTSYSAWCKDIPTAGGKGGGVRHSITAVDAVNLNGTDYLVIEDSWGKFGGKYGQNGQRLISRSMWADGFYFAAVLTDFEYSSNDKASFDKFEKVMTYGTKQPEVVRLQDFLKTQGLMPSNLDSTGYYGEITRKAVYLFQVKNGVDSLDILNSINGKRVGVKTLAKINEIIKK